MGKGVAGSETSLLNLLVSQRLCCLLGLQMETSENVETLWALL